MRMFRHTIWIARPREAVFAFFADFPRASRWRSYVHSMEPLDAGPLRVGSRLRTVMDLRGERYAFDLTVLAYDPPALWRHRSDESDLEGFIEYRFDTEQGGTRVTMSAVVKPVGLYGWLAVPLLWLSRRTAYREQLPQLKRAMEG